MRDFPNRILAQRRYEEYNVHISKLKPLLTEYKQVLLFALFCRTSCGPEDQDELESSDNKPRILLLGLRRFVHTMILFWCWVDRGFYGSRGYAAYSNFGGMKLL